MSTGAMAGLIQNLEGTGMMQAAGDNEISEAGDDGTSEEVDDFASLLAALSSSEEGEAAGLIEMMGENEEVDLSAHEVHLSLIMLLTSGEIRETPEGEELLSRLQSGQSPNEILAGADESLINQLMEELEVLISRENLESLEAELTGLNGRKKLDIQDFIPEEILEEMEIEGLNEEKTERMKLLLGDIFDSKAANDSELDMSGSDEQDAFSRLQALLGDRTETGSSFSEKASSEDYQMDLEMLGEELDLDSGEIKSLIEQIESSLDGEVGFPHEGENLKENAELTGEAYRIWSELAARTEADTAAKDVEIEELFQSLSPQTEEIPLQESIDLEKLIGSETGDWKNMISDLLAEGAESTAEFGEYFSQQEFSWGFSDPEEGFLSKKENLSAEDSAVESAVDLEQLMMSELKSDSNTAEITGRPRQGTSSDQLGVMEQITDSIQFMEQQGENTLELELEPEFLGRVNLNVTVEDSGVIAHMLVENNTVRRELENNLHMLQRTLNREGFDVERITIESRDGEGNLQNHNDNSGYHQGESGHGSSGNGRQFQDQFQPVIAQNLSGLDEDLAGIDGELRRWLMWKQYQYDWI